jgi:hypothetical protein
MLVQSRPFSVPVKRPLKTRVAVAELLAVGLLLHVGRTDLPLMPHLDRQKCLLMAKRGGGIAMTQLTCSRAVREQLFEIISHGHE